MVLGRQVRYMNQEARFHETLHKLAMIDEGFIQDKARLALDLTRTSTLDPKMAALLMLGVAVAIGSSSYCLQWSVSRALAAGASEEEITDSLLVIAPVIGLGRVVSAAPDLAAALGYDVEAALYDPDDP
jgi:4-carboxymuconolactone decarboxylase